MEAFLRLDCLRLAASLACSYLVACLTRLRFTASLSCSYLAAYLTRLCLVVLATMF